MNKLKLFLYADGVVIFAGAIFFAYLYLRRGRVDHFRTDLWKERPSLNPEQRAAEAQRDQQFLLDDPDGYDFDPYGRTSPSIPRPGEPLLTGAPKAKDAPRAASAKPPRPAAGPRPAPAPKPEFRVPNFHGKPYEILGIPANADAATVSRAHKFWIKRYHPDRVSHLGQVYVDQARRRAEQLNSARHALLQALAQKR